MNRKHGRRTMAVWVGLLLAVGSGLGSARASELSWNAGDAERQKAFVGFMRAATLAAGRGDRAATQAALRRATLAGGYTLASSIYQARCGERAFQMPFWVVEVQARIGDVEGARETARGAGDASTSLSALYLLARAQTAPFPKKGQYIFREALRTDPQNVFGFQYRNVDFTSLSRLHLPPQRRAGWQTLRLGLPYAQAIDRVQARRQTYHSADRVFADAGEVARLAVWQASIGDVDGARATVAVITRADLRALTLVEVAQNLQRANLAAATKARVDAAQLAQSLSDPMMQATFRQGCGVLSMRAKDYVGARRQFVQAASTARRISDARMRANALWVIGMSFSAPEMDGSGDISGPVSLASANHATAQDLLRAQRAAILQITDVPRPEPKGRKDLNFSNAMQQMDESRVELLVNIATEFSESAETDKTLTLARQITAQEPSLYWRERYTRLLDRLEEHYAQESAWLRKPRH